MVAPVSVWVMPPMCTGGWPKCHTGRALAVKYQATQLFGQKSRNLWRIWEDTKPCVGSSGMDKQFI
jgi:hypothetical protein